MPMRRLPRKLPPFPSTSLLAESTPISTWMVFNYVPGGDHGSSISSVWQCNSLCPAAMSVKLRQFTCSCSYTALGTRDLPSILCMRSLSGTHVNPSDASCHRCTRGGAFDLPFQFRARRPKPQQKLSRLIVASPALLHVLLFTYNHCPFQSSGNASCVMTVLCGWMDPGYKGLYQVPDIIQLRYAE